MNFSLSPALEKEFAKNRVHAVFLDILEDLKHIFGLEAKDCTLPAETAHTFWNHIADIAVDIPYLFPNRRIFQFTRFLFLALAFWFVIGQPLIKGIANINAGQPLVPNIGQINLPAFLAPSTATLTPTLTPTMTPSPTLTPTVTPTPTITPSPTATPLPTPVGIDFFTENYLTWCVPENGISEEEFLEMASSLQLEGEWRYGGSGGLLYQEGSPRETGTYLEGCFNLYPWPAPETGDFYLDAILGYRANKSGIVPVLFDRHWYQIGIDHNVSHKILVQP